jgi:hypothetical protein
MTIGMRWFPERKGMAMGVVVGGVGGGAFVFNQIQVRWKHVCFSRAKLPVRPVCI